MIQSQAVALDFIGKRGSAVGRAFALVHFLTFGLTKRFVWDRGCVWVLLGGCLLGVRGYDGMYRVHFVSESAQIELKSGRV